MIAEFKQLPPDRWSSGLWDAVIIGAGPAGSTVATLLARRKHHVLLLDKSHFPRPKVCGDILLPDSLACLDRLGLTKTVTAKACRLDRLRGISTGGTEFTVEGEYYSLQREQFDHLLVEESIRCGAQFGLGEVISVSESSQDHVSIQLRDSHSVEARIVIIATGADATLACSTGLGLERQVNAVALRTYIRSSHQITEGQLCYLREIAPGYAWIFPLGNGLYNVGCGVTLSSKKQYNLKKMYHTFITDYSPARQLLTDGEQLGHLGGAAIRFGLSDTSRVINGRILAVGETIGTTLPFSGEGIGIAMSSAEMAAEAIHLALQSDDPTALRSYQARLSEFKPLFRGYWAAQRWLRVPIFNDLAARRIKASPYLQTLCSGVLAGQTDPRRIYSLRGIFTSFWK
jgi:menaquinone-9 beta-reductase